MPPSFGEICAALGWGALSSLGLVVGTLVGAFSRLSHHAIALMMSVGAGLLLAAASLELATEAIRSAGPVRAVSSLLLGAAVASTANALLARFGAANRKRCGECTAQASEQQPGLLLLWSTIAIAAAVATAAAYAASGELGQSSPPHLQAFGAGALLAMTAETMIPEAFHNSPRFSGLLAAIGFCVVLLI